MAFMTQNANLLLLLLIVVSATGLVGATVYFQNNFEAINTEYNSKLQELAKVQADLTQQKTALSSISEELSLKSTREEDLTGKYQEVKGAKETLESEKQDLTRRTEVAETEALDAKRVAQAAEAEKLSLKDQVTQLNKDLANALSSISDARNQADQAIRDKVTCENARTACVNSLSACNARDCCSCPSS